MKTDHLFYRLFQEHPEVVFELAGWPLAPVADYTLHAEEVKQTTSLTARPPHWDCNGCN